MPNTTHINDDCEENDHISEIKEINDDFLTIFSKAELRITKKQKRQLARAFGIVSKDADPGTKLTNALGFMQRILTDPCVAIEFYNNQDQFKYNLRNSLTWEINTFGEEENKHARRLATTYTFVATLMYSGITPKGGDVIWFTESKGPYGHRYYTAYRKKPKNAIAVATFKAK